MSTLSRKIFYFAIGLAGILLLVLGGAYLTLRSMDLNSMRPEVITKVKQLTGRELLFEGDLVIGLQDGLVVHAEGLALSNATWGSRPWMLRLGDVTAHLALLPLLGGEIRVKRIDLEDVNLLLETDPSGEHNWNLAFPSGDRGKAIADIPSISVKSGQVTWLSPGKQGPRALVVEQLQLSMDVDAQTLHLEAGARVQGEQLELEGRLPTLSALARGRSIESDLQLRLADMSLKAGGFLQQASWGFDPSLEVQAKHLDLAHIGRLSAHSLPAIPRLDLAFRLEREAGVWKFSEIAAGSGGSRLQGDLQLDTGGRLPRLTGRLTSEQLDLAELIPASETDRQDDSVSSSGDSGAWLQVLKRLDAAVQIRLARFTARDVEYQNLQVDGRLEQGRLVLQPVKADIVGGGSMTGRLEIDAAGEQPQWILAYASRKTPAGLLLGPKLASLVKAPVDLVLDLRTTGSGLRSMTGNLSGVVRLVVGKGTARIKKLDTLVGGLTTLTGQLLSPGSENAHLNCAVGDFKLTRGVATTQVLLIDTHVSTVRGDGRIDLGAQRIDLTFTPKPKTPTLTVAVPVHVRGPLRKPQFIKDTKATLGRLLGIAGIFVYPPAAVVGLGDLGGNENPCIGLIQGKASEGEGKPDPAKQPSSSRNPLKSLGRGLKKLFGQ